MSARTPSLAELQRRARESTLESRLRRRKPSRRPLVLFGLEVAGYAVIALGLFATVWRVFA